MFFCNGDNMTHREIKGNCIKRDYDLLNTACIDCYTEHIGILVHKHAIELFKQYNTHGKHGYRSFTVMHNNISALIEQLITIQLTLESQEMTTKKYEQLKNDIKHNIKQHE